MASVAHAFGAEVADPRREGFGASARCWVMGPDIRC